MIETSPKLRDLNNIKGFGSSAAIAAMLATGPVMPAMAQQSPVAVPTREELDPAPVREDRRKPKLTVDEQVERAPCALDDPTYASIKIKLNAVTFNNLGPVTASDLGPAYADYIGKEAPISVLCRIRDAAATKLRSMGYVAAVQVPVQEIDSGAVRFEILFAKVTSIRVVGAAGRNEKLIESYLSKLADGAYFNRFDAERYLLLARDIPGYEVRLALKPAGTGAGNMIGEITLKRTAASFDFSAQNYGGSSTGRFGGQLRATFNGITGMGDRTTLSFYSTADISEQKVVQFGHDMLLGGEGLRLGGRLTYAWTKPDLGTALRDINAKTLFANVELSYPIVRKLAFTLRAATGLDLVNQRVNFAGLPLSEDKLRVGYLRLDADAVDLKGIGPRGAIGWRFNASLEARKGLAIFEASPNCVTAPAQCAAPGFARPSLADADPTAHLIRFAATAEVRPVHNVTFAISPRAQTGSHGLFAFEQFSTGNYTIGRGYDPGALVGDRGAGIQTELRLDGFRLTPRSKINFQPYAFADTAWLWDRATLPSGSARLTSLGGGVRIGVAGRARLDLTVGVPRTVLPGETRRRNPRFLMSLVTTLPPLGKK